MKLRGDAGDNFRFVPRGVDENTRVEVERKFARSMEALKGVNELVDCAASINILPSLFPTSGEVFKGDS